MDKWIEELQAGTFYQYEDEWNFLQEQAERATGSGKAADYLMLLIAQDMKLARSGNSLADRLGA